MATALDLLMSAKEDVNLLSEESDICTIDAKTRTIFVPSTIVVGGVQSDKNAERIKFSCPKIVGDNLDLSKFSVRINFENVSSVDFNVSIKDQYICDDVAVDGENVTFSWLIGRNAARYMGTVRFIVCAVKTDSDSNISVEWNTAIAEVPVLEGIEIDQPQIGQEEKDVINQLLELTKNTSAEAVQNVNSAKEQAIKDIQSVSQPDTTLTIEGGLAEAKATGEAIGSLKGDLGNLSIVKIGENKCTNKNEVYGSTIYLPVFLEKSKSYIIYNPTSETLKGCAINVVNSENDDILIAVKPTGWVLPNPKDKTQSFLSIVDDGWYRIRLSYQSVFTEEQKAMYGTGWMVKEIPTVDYVPTSFDYAEYKESVLAKESVNAEKANYAEKAGSIAQKEENVACTGDSLTYGYGASPGSTDYPTVLTKLCGKTVYNLGVSGESTDEILARQGGFPAIINPVIIPADTSNVEITFIGTVNIGGENTTLLRKDSGKLVNPVIIDGVEGNISASNNKYYFTRLKDGTAHEVKRPQYVITKEMREHKDDIQIIFMGTNGGWMITADDAETRIKKLTSQIDMMIDYNTSKKYIIIGMHYFYSWVLYNGLTKEQLENAMLLKYGNHYINLRKYMIKYGLADAGLTATEKDTEAINNGNVPPSLLYSDGIHGNAYFYNILANLVNKKGIELGYWN